MRGLKTIVFFAAIVATMLCFLFFATRGDRARLANERSALKAAGLSASQGMGPSSGATHGAEMNKARAASGAMSRGTHGNPSGASMQVNVSHARAAKIGEALSYTSAFRVAMTEYFMSEGKWPASNAEIGMPAPEKYMRPSLNSISVMPEGIIQIELSAYGGKPQRIWLRATPDETGAVVWSCTTPDIRDVALIIPACAYQGV